MQITPPPQNHPPRILPRLRLGPQRLPYLRVLELRQLVVLAPVRMVLDEERARLVGAAVLDEPARGPGHPGDDDDHYEGGGVVDLQ